jgi:predicted phage terminase large subunit-like protein
MRHIIHEAEPRVLNAMLRLSFSSFVRRSFHTLSPGSAFKMNWHVQAIAYHLEQVRLGKMKRLIINLAPGTLKSLITSIAWPAFILGHDPTKRLAVISYGSELAVTLGNDFRQIINSSWYKELFPLMQISSRKNTELEVITTQNGYRLGTTIEGSLTGLHPDIIVIDDPLKPMDAFSDRKREKVNAWFYQTLRSRLNDPQAGAFILVMQRLHEDDLTARLLRSSDEWTVLSLPAIAEGEEWISISDHQHHVRHAGDVLHPQREMREDLQQLRTQVGPEIFAAQWQQSPVPASGAMIKRDYFRYYDGLPPETLSSPVFQAWDVASKDGELNDWSVCTTWRRHNRKYYLIDVLRDRLDFPELKDCAISYARAQHARVIRIEDAGLGTGLIAELKRAGLSIVGVRPEQSKQMRLQMQLIKFRNGDVLFPRLATFLPELEAELLAFPRGRFDDQVDSVCLALSHEAPTYDLEKANAGFEKFTTALWEQRQFQQRIYGF